MKVIYTYLIGFLLFCVATQSNAQVLAQWHFEDPAYSSMNPSTAPTSVSAGITASSFTSVGVSSTVASPGYDGSANCGTYPGSPYPAPCYSYQATGWPTANAVDLGKYHEFSIGVQPGCTFKLIGLRFGYRVDYTASLEVRTSYDNFAAPWGPVITDATQRNWNGFTRTGNSAGVPGNVSGLTNLTFRFYYYNAMGFLSSQTALTYNDAVQIFGRVTCPVAMPVEFVSFAGKAAGNRVQLNWETSLERNADRFEVERSQNASEFGSIGQVKAAGDATQNQFYGFSDEQPLTGVNYYRLRQVDRDGSVQHSKIIAVTPNPDSPAILVLGNPTEGSRINLQLFNIEASKLQLTDVQGRSVPFRITESAKGIVTLEPTSSLSNGIYLIRADKGSTVKIVVR